MANYTTTIRVTTPLTANQDPLAKLKTAASQGDRQEPLRILEKITEILRAGARYESGAAVASTLEFQVASTAMVRAKQTLTFSAAPTAGHTYTIHGTAFTAVSNGSTPTNNQFKIGVNANQAACNLAAAINASTTAGISKVVFATALGKAASGTAACSTVIATDTLTIDTVTLTVVADAAAKALLPDTDFTGAVVVGGTNTAMGDNFAAAINTHPTLKKKFKASNNSGTVTVTALAIGAAGNVLFSETGDTITCSGSGLLTGGCDSVGTGNADISTSNGVVTVYARAVGSVANDITVATNDASTMALGNSTFGGGAGDDALPWVIKYF